MKIVIQRVSSAEVIINTQTKRSIGSGLVVLIGITDTDTEEDVRYLVDKMCHLRIFEDDEGKMNLSALDVSADLLLISQFTLYGDASKGRRPSFIKAARPDFAIPLYEKFITYSKSFGLNTGTGEFGADMQVQLVNDGPVTLIVESREK